MTCWRFYNKLGFISMVYTYTTKYVRMKGIVETNFREFAAHT